MYIYGKRNRINGKENGSYNLGCRDVQGLGFRVWDVEFPQLQENHMENEMATTTTTRRYKQKH